MAEPTLIKQPGAGEKKSVFIHPQEVVNFDFDLKSARIDILGSDIVFTFKDGGQLILDNVAVSLFSDDAPHLLMQNNPISADEVLSSIGMVQSVSGKDAALLTSMIVDKTTHEQKQQEGKVVEKVVVKESPPIIIQPPPTLSQSDSHASQGAHFEQQFKKAFDELLTSRAKDIADNIYTGKFNTPPVTLNPPKIEAQAPPPPVDNPVTATYSITPKLLQLDATSSTSGGVLTYEGGTGSQSATLISDSLTQIQRQFIDITRHAGAATIYTNDPTYTQPNLLSRALNIDTDVPNNYAISQVRISGLPAGFDLQGYTRQADGSYLMTGGQIQSGATQRYILQYDPTALGVASDLDGNGQAHDYRTFNLTVSSSVVGGVLGITLTDSHVIPVIVKDTSITDYAYNGQASGWVLDTKPNENIIVAGDGGVTVYGSAVLDRISTGTGNDTIYGDGGDDTITTSSGADTIDVGTGNNIVDGGDGVDLLTYTTRSVDISFDLGGAQNAFGEVTITVGASQSDLVKNIENVTTGSGNDTLIGSALANVLTGGDGNDFLMGRDGDDTLIGGNGTDTVSYSYAGNGVTVDLQAGTAAVSATDNDTIATTENVIGSDYDDTIRGDANINDLQGGLGDDLLNGRTGNDTIDGGAGNNTISFADQASAVTLALQDTGISTATTSGGDTITLSNIQNITGSAYNDVLTGNNVDNIIRSGDGNDTLDGGSGAADVLSYDDQAAGVTADLGAGTVTKNAGTDTFSNFDIITGTGFDDTIIGGSLISVINGGAGTDTLSYQNTAGAVTVDLVSLTTTGALTNSFTSIENVTGGSGDDTLTGDANNNVMSGGNGNDTIYASGGTDTLNGDGGTDTAVFTAFPAAFTAYLGEASLVVDDDPNDVIDPLTGSRVGVNPLTGLEENPGPYYNDYSTLVGVETIVGTNYDDVFVSGATSRTLNLDGGTGTDIMSFATETTAVTADLSGTATGAFGSYTFLSNSVENLVGGSAGDTLTGTTGDNLIYGNAGNDTLNGNGGTDTLDGGLGTDTATYASFAAAVTVDLAALTVTDASAGVSTLVNIEAVTGSDNNDTFLSGLSIANFTLDGGAGTDTLSFAPLQAAVTANLTTGVATVGLGQQYTISNFENLIGGGLNDLLTGSAGDNVIDAGNGSDIVYASGGTDTIDGGSGFDYFNYFSTFGNPYTVMLGAPNITVTDGATINTTLMNFEWIFSTSGNDVFYSGSVARTLELDGQGGTDTINFSSETTAVTANLSSSATGAFGTYNFYQDRIENLVGGSGNDTLTGSAYDFYSVGNNVISGGDGDDTINGNGGNDTIDGGNGTDTVTFASVTSDIAVNLGTGSVVYTDASNHGSSSTVTNVETYITGSGNDTFTVGGTGQTLTLNAGTGSNDSISFASYATAVTADLTSTATGSFGTFTFVGGSFENITGGSSDDTLTGTASANIINGGAGNDTLTGGAGADTIYGGLGTDTISGGTEDDIIDDSGSTYATNHSNIINADAGNDTIYLTVADNTIDGGLGTDSLRYDQLTFSFSPFTYGTGTSSDLTFTLASNSLSGTVTDGTHTDSFSNIENFYGSNGNDIFKGGSGHDTFFGGNGIDTMDYSTSAAAGITINLQTGVTSNDGQGNTDAFSGVENVIGSGFDDAITDSTSNNVLNGGDGNDTFTVGSGNDVIDGGNGTDTLSYAAQSTAITFNLNLSSATSSAIGTDSFLNIEQINSGSGNDIVNATPGNLFANTVNYNLGSGSNDKISLSSGTVGTDATTVANHFSNVEYLDFQNANTAGGNMVIDGDDVFSLTDSNHALRLDINAGFGLTINGGSYSLSSGATVGGVTTYTFSSGATPVSTLEVHVI